MLKRLRDLNGDSFGKVCQRRARWDTGDMDTGDIDTGDIDTGDMDTAFGHSSLPRCE